MPGSGCSPVIGINGKKKKKRSTIPLLVTSPFQPGSFLVNIVNVMKLNFSFWEHSRSRLAHWESEKTRLLSGLFRSSPSDFGYQAMRALMGLKHHSVQPGVAQGRKLSLRAEEVTHEWRVCASVQPSPLHCSTALCQRPLCLLSPPDISRWPLTWSGLKTVSNCHSWEGKYFGC